MRVFEDRHEAGPPLAGELLPYTGPPRVLRLRLVPGGRPLRCQPRPGVRALRAANPAKSVVAAPVGAAAPIDELRNVVDEVVCLETPESFYAVGQWYIDFASTTDEEVRKLVSGSKTQTGRPEVSIPAG